MTELGCLVSGKDTDIFAQTKIHWSMSQEMARWTSTAFRHEAWGEADPCDSAKWTAIVEPLLERLNHIVSTDFPIPRPYTNVNRPPDPPSPIQDRTEATDADAPTSNATITTQAPATPVRQLPPGSSLPQFLRNLPHPRVPPTLTIPCILPATISRVPPQRPYFSYSNQ